MTLDQIREKLEYEITPALRTLSTVNSFSLFWEDCSFIAITHGDRFYLTLTKKEPRETIYGLTTIDFTGLDEQLVEPALEFLIERLKELV